MKLRNKQRVDLILGTILIGILRFPVAMLGRIFKFDHSLYPKGDILVIKMQGGGSLVLAFPALYGIKKKFKHVRIKLFTTQSVRPFAESLDIFDEIITLDETNILLTLTSVVHSLWKCLRIDTVIDLEVYSRITTVFGILTLARNRIGFYLESLFWRKNIYTHLIFFNRSSNVCFLYNEIARLLSAPVESYDTCARQLRKYLVPVEKSQRTRITIGHACSELGKERILTAEQWLLIFQKRNVESQEFLFLGAAGDFASAQEIIDFIKPHFPDAVFINECGRTNLAESVSIIDSADEFWGIDSGLLHYARLLGKKNVSFWGPTDPLTRLEKIPGVVTEAYYTRVSCSPCVHVAELPPCDGDNICIRSIFDKDVAPEKSKDTIETIRQL